MTPFRAFVTRGAAALVAVAVLCLTGCASSPSSGVATTQPAGLDTQILAHQGEIKLVSSLTTATVLVSVDADSQAKVGAFAYQVADTVEQAVLNNAVDLSLVKRYVASQVTKVQPKYRIIVGTLLDELSTVVESKLDTYLAGQPADVRKKAASVLLLAITDGVKEATASFKPAPGSVPMVTPFEFAPPTTQP